MLSQKMEWNVAAMWRTSVNKTSVNINHLVTVTGTENKKTDKPFPFNRL